MHFFEVNLSFEGLCDYISYFKWISLSLPKFFIKKTKLKSLILHNKKSKFQVLEQLKFLGLHMSCKLKSNNKNSETTFNELMIQDLANQSRNITMPDYKRKLNIRSLDCSKIHINKLQPSDALKAKFDKAISSLIQDAQRGYFAKLAKKNVLIIIWIHFLKISYSYCNEAFTPQLVDCHLTSLKKITKNIKFPKNPQAFQECELISTNSRVKLTTKSYLSKILIMQKISQDYFRCDLKSFFKKIFYNYTIYNETLNNNSINMSNRSFLESKTSHIKLRFKLNTTNLKTSPNSKFPETQFISFLSFPKTLIKDETTINILVKAFGVNNIELENFFVLSGLEPVRNEQIISVNNISNRLIESLNHRNFGKIKVFECFSSVINTIIKVSINDSNKNLEYEISNSKIEKIEKIKKPQNKVNYTKNLFATIIKKKIRDIFSHEINIHNELSILFSREKKRKKESRDYCNSCEKIICMISNTYVRCNSCKRLFHITCYKNQSTHILSPSQVENYYCEVCNSKRSLMYDKLVIFEIRKQGLLKSITPIEENIMHFEDSNSSTTYIKTDQVRKSSVYDTFKIQSSIETKGGKFKIVDGDMHRSNSSRIISHDLYYNKSILYSNFVIINKNFKFRGTNKFFDRYNQNHFFKEISMISNFTQFLRTKAIRPITMKVILTEILKADIHCKNVSHSSIELMSGLVKDLLEYIIRGRLSNLCNEKGSRYISTTTPSDLNFKKSLKNMTNRYKKWLLKLNLENLPDIFRRFLTSSFNKTYQINLSSLEKINDNYRTEKILDLAESDSTKLSVELALVLELDNAYFYNTDVYLIILRILREEIENSRFFRKEIHTRITKKSNRQETTVKFFNSMLACYKGSKRVIRNFCSVFLSNLILLKLYFLKQKYIQNKKLIISSEICNIIIVTLIEWMKDKRFYHFIHTTEKNVTELIKIFHTSKSSEHQFNIKVNQLKRAVLSHCTIRGLCSILIDIENALMKTGSNLVTSNLIQASKKKHDHDIFCVTEVHNIKNKQFVKNLQENVRNLANESAYNINFKTLEYVEELEYELQKSKNKEYLWNSTKKA